MAITKLRRSLFIGLGGTGIKTILKTKGVMMDNYGQNGELPPILGFLGIDTDRAEYDLTSKTKHGEIKLMANERYSISVESPRPHYNTYKKDYEWLPAQNVTFINTLDRGAGQVRTNGRLAVMYHRGPLKERIKQAISDVYTSQINDMKWKEFSAMEDSDDGQAKLEIHLVFSICGGTGAGTFLDVAYLIREILQESAYKANLNGYAVMPGIFQAEIKSVVAKSRVVPNAYGCLRDLDYLMSLDLDDSKTFALNWGDSSHETGELPFDSLVLVDNTNGAGLNYSKMSALTDMISQALLATTGQIGNQASSVGDNVKNDMLLKSFDFGGKRAWVSSMGTATILYDSRDVAQVYSLKAQNQLISRLIAEDEEANKVSNTWIDNVKIREHNRDDVIDTLYDLATLTQMSLNDSDYDNRNCVEKIKNKASSYLLGLDLSDEDWNNRVDALFAKVSAALEAKIKEILDTNCSVGLAEGFLMDVKNQVENLFRQEMIDEQRDHENQLKEAKADLDTKIENLHQYLNKGWFHTKQDTYISAIKAAAYDVVLETIEVKRRSFASRFYSKLIEKLDSELLVIGNTKAVFKQIHADNLVEIQRRQNGVDVDRAVAEDLSEDMLRIIDADMSEFPLTEFVAKLPSKTLCEIPGKAELIDILNKLTESLPKYKEILTQDIDSVLDAMPKDQFDAYIQSVSSKALPFLKVDGHGRQIGKTSTRRDIGKDQNYYICVPDEKTCRLTRDGYYKQVLNANAEVISTGLTDRIIIYCARCPVPAFAIAGLDAMGIPYWQERDAVSFHFDEQLRQRMEEEFFEFEPKNINADEALEAWVKACILGLIKFDKTYWVYDDEKQIAGGQEEVWTNFHSAYRDKAFDAFSKNPALFKQIDEKFKRHLEDMGKKKAEELKNDVLKNYFTNYSRCQLQWTTIAKEPVSIEYIPTKKLFQQETQLLEKLFR